MLTDNRILVECHKPLPAIMCVQRRAAKKVVTEGDAIAANIASFGDEIGKTTNWITSMFEVQSNYEKGSREYETLAYRICCGQLYQQNCIDRSKGIVSKPMPRYWHDRHSINKIEDPEERRFQLSIVADKKPYFMRIVYPALAHQYNTYIKSTTKNALREFGLTVEELEQIPEGNRTERQSEFLKYFYARLPVGIGDCVMNKICRRFEQEFDGFLSKYLSEVPFDPSFMKSNRGYSESEFKSVSRLYSSYCKRTKDYTIFITYEHVDPDESAAVLTQIRDDFVKECRIACPNAESLCDAVIDICYTKSSSKRFVWDVCGQQIIDNLLKANGGRIQFPAQSDEGNLRHCGRTFEVRDVCLEELNGNSVE